jgi:glycosyltransferase involved in cell wall biosynthesis
VAAILELSKRPFFGEMEFKVVGEGRLFEETVAPLRSFTNVKLENRSLSESEYRDIFAEHGVFLCPTRWDSQGVSRDEAMSCGLVAITNKVAAIPEFVDEGCCMLVPPEDHIAMADAMERLYRDPALYQRLSKAGAERVKVTSGFEQTIRREMALARSKR